MPALTFPEALLIAFLLVCLALWYCQGE